MCGILGSLDHQLISEQCFDAMLDTLHSRGPDGFGTKALRDDRVRLGHKRLSIIDLSDAGTQPMPNEDESVWLVFNGEIYNFAELRRCLESLGHRFRSRTDSEVIIHAYEEWGDECIHHFRGIFAFVIWDEPKQRLFAARDQIGVKPLYYWQHDGGVTLASQPRAILEHPRFSRSINEDALNAYFACGYVPHDSAIFNGMFKLPAGHQLVYSNGQLVIDEYWQLSYSPEITDPNEAGLAVRNAIEEAVRLQMVSDVPIGVFLSGGVDSSTVASLAKRLSGDCIPSFTIGFDQPDKDERQYAALAAQTIGTKPHVREMSLGNAFEYLCKFVNTYDEPFFDSSALPTLMVSELAHDNDIKVILAGDGADEVFAGYLRYDLMAQPERLERLRRLVFGENTETSLGRFFGEVGFLDSESIKLLTGRRGGDHLATFRRFWNPDIPPVTASQLLDMKTYLVDDILTKVDRASMACSVEARVPFLDHRLVETAFKIDSRLIYAGSERKALMKFAVHNWVPSEVLTTRKKGFSIPTHQWMEQQLASTASGLLRDGSLVSRGHLQGDGLKWLLTTGNPFHMWLVMIAELWARRWMEDQPVNEQQLHQFH